MLNQPIGSKPNRKVVSHWVKDAWDKVQSSTIQATWRHIGCTTTRINCVGIHNSDKEKGSDEDEDPLALANDDDADKGGSDEESIVLFCFS